MTIFYVGMPVAIGLLIGSIWVSSLFGLGIIFGATSLGFGLAFGLTDIDTDKNGSNNQPE